MNLKGFFKKLIDFIVLGRQAGLWEKDHSPDLKKRPR